MSGRHLIEVTSESTNLDQFRVLKLNRPLIRRNNVIGFNSRDIEARSFNLLRTSLSKRLKAAGHRVIGVTSAAPEAGKSFLAINLGAALAQVSEGPIFLVDLDLRRASLAASIGLDAAFSINDYLAGNLTDLTEAGVRVQDTPLVIFPATKTGNPPAELLKGERLIVMFAALRALNEKATILIDLPPVFADDDAMLIAENLDAYLLVVDAGRTTKKQVKEALGMMQPVPCTGTVLNRYKGGIMDSYGYGYGYGVYSKYYR